MIKIHELRQRYYNLRIHPPGHWRAYEDQAPIQEKLKQAGIKRRGWRHTEETKKIIGLTGIGRQTNNGQHWYNNGIKNTLSFKKPSLGWQSGRTFSKRKKRWHTPRIKALLTPEERSEIAHKRQVTKGPAQRRAEARKGAFKRTKEQWHKTALAREAKKRDAKQLKI